jgi:hypothetical protein
MPDTTSAKSARVGRRITIDKEVFELVPVYMEITKRVRKKYGFSENDISQRFVGYLLTPPEEKK